MVYHWEKSLREYSKNQSQESRLHQPSGALLHKLADSLKGGQQQFVVICPTKQNKRMKNHGGQAIRNSELERLQSPRKQQTKQHTKAKRSPYGSPKTNRALTTHHKKHQNPLQSPPKAKYQELPTPHPNEQHTKHRGRSRF